MVFNHPLLRCFSEAEKATNAASDSWFCSHTGASFGCGIARVPTVQNLDGRLEEAFPIYNTGHLSASSEQFNGLYRQNVLRAANAPKGLHRHV